MCRRNVACVCVGLSKRQTNKGINNVYVRFANCCRYNDVGDETNNIQENFARIVTEELVGPWPNQLVNIPPHNYQLAEYPQ